MTGKLENRMTLFRLALLLLTIGCCPASYSANLRGPEDVTARLVEIAETTHLEDAEILAEVFQELHFSDARLSNDNSWVQRKHADGAEDFASVDYVSTSKSVYIMIYPSQCLAYEKAVDIVSKKWGVAPNDDYRLSRPEQFGEWTRRVPVDLPASFTMSTLSPTGNALAFAVTGDCVRRVSISRNRINH